MSSASLFLITLVMTVQTFAQHPPYDVGPEAKPPCERVRYDRSQKEGHLAYAVQFTVWVSDVA
jgi:hypothetical protein